MPKILFLFLFAFAPLLACAAPPADDAIVLPNGLRVILRERHERSLVAVDLWIRAGSREEKSGEEGCAHFLEHALFKGTTTHGPGELDFALEMLGGVFQASTGPDYARFGATLPAANLESALPLFADLVCHATLPAAEIERERGPILDELAVRGDDITACLVERAYALAFATHPYRNSPGGTADAIQTRKEETLVSFYHRTYTPERTTLVLVGDFDSMKARIAIEKSFGDWKAGVAGENPPAEPEMSAPRSLAESVAGKTGRIGIAFRIPPASDKEATVTLRLIAALLGESDGYGQFATDALKGTEATVRYTPRLDSSLFLLTANVPKSADASRIETALLTAVEHLQTTPVSLSELNAARQQVLAQTRYDGETNAGLARQRGYADLVQGDTPEGLQKVVIHIKPADIQQIARRYLDSGHAATVRFSANGKEAANGTR